MMWVACPVFSTTGYCRTSSSLNLFVRAFVSPRHSSTGTTSSGLVHSPFFFPLCVHSVRRLRMLSCRRALQRCKTADVTQRCRCSEARRRDYAALQSEDVDVALTSQRGTKK